MTCSQLSSSEPLAGTATEAARFLLVEHRGRWGRDPLDDETGLPGNLRETARSFDGRVLLIRRPGWTGRVADPIAVDVVSDGEMTSDGPLLLVCAHGRRDRCCARLGVPLYEALRPHVQEDRLWQSSHHGGHRFAANLLALPSGVQLGRVPPEAAARVALLLAENRIPLDWYRGRTAHTQRQQAAEIAVRRDLELDAVGDVCPLDDDGATVRVAAPEGIVQVTVTEETGPALPASCDAEPEPSRRFVAMPRW